MVSAKGMPGYREFTEEAIIVNVIPYREIDCIVSFFSEKKGKLSGFAFGGLKSRKRFLGTLEKLNYVVITYQEYKGYISLKEALLKKRFSSIHRDVNKLGMAINCIKFLLSVHKGPVDSEKVFKVVLNFLNILNSKVNIPFYFPLLFRARLCSEYGYFPTLDKCLDCFKRIGSEGGVFFLKDKKIRCLKCAHRKRGGIYLSSKEIKRLSFVFGASSLALEEVNFENEGVDKRKILFLLERFVDETLGDFLHKRD